ncbi:hypothetical protein EDB85DRAFT_1895035 [Lactarius pseudohatsudake]|nr:hypothetical protein EDB85DRAFT_1895035 [Lactarius pseudohatsudake]
MFPLSSTSLGFSMTKGSFRKLHLQSPRSLVSLQESRRRKPTEHPGTGTLCEDIGSCEEDVEIIVYVVTHPRNGKLASTPTQSSPDGKTPPLARPVPVAALVHRKTYDVPHALALSPEPDLKLWSEPVPRDVVVPAPSPAPAPVLASFSLLSSSPKPTRYARWPRRKAERNTMFGLFGTICAEATLRVDPQRVKRRRGGSGVDRGGSTLMVPPSLFSAKEFLKPSLSSPSAARIPRAPSANSKSVDFAIAASRTLPIFVFVCVLQAVHPLPASSLKIPPRNSIPTIPSFAGFISIDTLESLEHESSDELEIDYADFMNEIEATRVDMFLPDNTACLNDFAVGPLDGSVTARIQDFLDKGDDILCAKDRKQRNPIFRAIYNSEFEVVLDDFIDKLHGEWERDCVKKAERKRLCELERIAAAADPFTLKKKGGKNARKAARQAAASVSLGTVVGHIRRFVEDLGRASTLSLPLMARHAHKSVHELAHALSLKSKSVGNGAARFSKLVRMTFGERNVARIWSSRRRCMGAVVQWKGGRKICLRDCEVVTG